MKRYFSLFVLLCFSLNVSASTGTLQALERHVDEYQYALTVEWNQKDAHFREERTNRFISEAKAILEKEVVSSKALEELLVMKLGDHPLFEALKLKLALSPVRTSAELSVFLEENAKDFYQRGASWNGSAGPTLGLLAVIGGIALFIVLMNAADGPGANCLRHETQFYCKERYDREGNLTSQDCGNHQVCAEYEVYEPRT